MPIKGIILIFALAIAVAVCCREEIATGIKDILSDRKNNQTKENEEKENEE